MGRPCAAATEVLDLPPAVIEMLARYRGMRAEQGGDWGEEGIEMFRWARFAALGPDVSRSSARPATGRGPYATWSATTRRGVVVVRVGVDGATVHSGPPRPVVAGVPMPMDVVVDSGVEREVAVVVAGEAFTVASGGAGVATVDVDAALSVTVDGAPVSLAAAVEPTAGASLRLRAARCARWSVTDATGGAWFPDGVLRKWDVRGRPYFHADEVTLTVPAGALTVTARGASSSPSSSGRSPARPSSRSSRRGASTRPRTAGTGATCTST